MGTETTTIIKAEITIVNHGDFSELTDKDLGEWIKMCLNADDVQIKKVKNFVND